MNQADETGALAFAEYYVTLTSYAASTGDFTELEALSGPDCQFCQSFIAHQKPDTEAGIWATVPDVRTLKYREQANPDIPGRFRVDIIAWHDTYQEVHPDGRIEEREAETSMFAVIIDYGDNGWVMTDAEVVDPDLWDSTGPDQ
ncbi:MAG: DUF6318 family protein [Actinomycetaceae bacterium]|nr:DUF6318 family protein [Actinomycetaceae bacterium]